MGGDTQGELARKIEEIVKAVEWVTGGKAREVKILPGGGVTVIINDGRYAKIMDEVPMFLEDPHAVADLNIAFKN